MVHGSPDLYGCLKTRSLDLYHMIRSVKTIVSLLALLVVTLFLGSCASSGEKVSHVAKSNIDMVADLHLRETRALLRELTTKLYKRNPRELAKADFLISERLDMLFHSHGSLQFDELGNGSETELMELSLSLEFQGDRVFCLMAGLVGMMNHSYNYQPEFHYLNAGLNEQKLYDSARNIERLSWRIKNSRDDGGRLILLSDGLNPDHPNLSYERLFGKLIAHQDIMAKVAEQKNKRMINMVATSLASFVFIPL